MRRAALVLLAALVLGNGTALAADPTGRMERILERGRLIVGVKTDYPPWGMVAPDGSIVGLEPDLARDAAERLGVALELVPVTAGNRLQRLDQGQVDLVIATLGDTAERRSMAGLVQPNYYASGVSLLARNGSPFHAWGHLRGRPVCLNEGAYFNRVLIERYLIDPVIFPATRDALLALRDGRCVGWAFDDTVIAQLLNEPGWAGYRMAMPSILHTPWAVAVRKGEAGAALGRFASDLVADWHRSGRLIALQAKWGLPASDFLSAQQAQWTRVADGRRHCQRDAASAWPPDCLIGEAQDGAAPAVTPSWVEPLRVANAAPLLDPLNRGRLLRGLGLTLGLSLVAVVGSLGVGVALAWADQSLGTSPATRALRLPLRGLTAVARMTPPILQLYILFFGLGGLLASHIGFTPGGFLVAGVVLSLYAGATNAILLRAALEHVRRERPGTPTHRLIPAAVDRCYEGLTATLVNIVKAAGLASTIALPELISAANTILAEGAPAGTIMNLLLVAYFLLVLAMLGVLRAARSGVRRLAWRG